MKGWHGQRLRHRLAAMKHKHSFGGRKYDVDSVKKVYIAGRIYYAIPDPFNNILRVWEADDYRRRQPPTWQFNLPNLPQDTGEAVKFLYEDGALK